MAEEALVVAPTTAARPQPRPGVERGGQVVVVGDLEVARLTCTLLAQAGLRVTHLLAPSEVELSEAMTADVGGVAVLVRRDVNALRYVLLAEHLRPGVSLTATVFDRTVARQLAHNVPNCVIHSPADVAAPTIVARCLGEDLVSVRPGRDGTIVHRQLAPGRLRTETWGHPSRLRRARRLPRVGLGDSTARMMLAGAGGLGAILVLDWLIGITLLHDSAVDTLFAAARVLATVGPAAAGAHTPQWYLVVASVLMLLAVVFTALFTAGLVDWLASARTVGLVGRRTLPRRGHVVVAGLGQVGLRVAFALRDAGIPVVGIERSPDAPNVRLARDGGVPVLIGHAQDRSVHRRVSLARARALAAMGSDDLDNIEVVISALATAPTARMVLRAGEGDVIAETRSLFAIGEVVDVSLFSAIVTSLRLQGQRCSLIHPRETSVCAHLEDETRVITHRPARCSC